MNVPTKRSGGSSKACSRPAGRGTAAARQAAGGVDRAPVVVGPPAADGIVIFEREADRIHQLMTSGAGRIAAMLGDTLAHRQGFAIRRSLSARAHSAAAAAAACPRIFARIHLPRSTGEVRVAYEVTVRMLPWPSSPPRVIASAET